MFVVYGTTPLSSWNPKAPDSIPPVETGIVQISEEDMIEITELINQITKAERNELAAVKPYIIITSGLPNEIKITTFSFGCSELESTNKLMNKLVSLAPYDIVNDEGEVLKPRTEEDLKNMFS